MRFGSIQFLWLILLVPLAAAFFVWAFRAKKAALNKFADGETLKHLLRSVSVSKQKIKPVLFIAGLMFTVLALAQPKWGYHWEEAKRRGLDIVIAVDVSKSMLAEDIKPSRLEAAKREIKSLLSVMKGDRVAIVSFAGEAFLQCPLTLDYGTAKLFVDYLSVESIPLGGTDITGAIKCAVKAFEGQEKKHRVLIIITDGEDHSGGALKAAEEAKKEGIVIFTIGIGTGEGAPIPMSDDKGNKTFVKNSSGEIVLSKMDSVLLQKIALITGGKKGTLGAGSFPLEEIYQNEVSKMEKKDLKSSREQRFENRFQVFLFIAILLFVIEAVLDERSGSKS
ncbi:MAG: VWA domain-containing protein [Candidatus Omnitrophica bacterium]|nr:VWA domain-containing protein [Candidatus Omnitrophota bacterium]